MKDTNGETAELFFPHLAGLYDTLSRYSYAFMRFSTGAVLVSLLLD